jgi:multiple sugar transport system permease protein
MSHQEIAQAIAVPRAKTRGWLGSRRKRIEAISAYVFLLPWITGLILLTAGPLAASLWLSFTNYDLFSQPHFIGLDNYVRMFTGDSRYWKAVTVTLAYVVMSVPLKLGFALALALVLNNNLRGSGFYRSVYYLPSLLGGSVAIAIMWRQIFSYNGALNAFLYNMFGFDGPSWITNPQYSLLTLVALAVWQFGSPMVIFLAGLKQIPQQLYDAGAVDGASRLQQFFFITLPLLTPVIFFNLVMQLIGAFQAFTSSFVVSGGTGGPADSTLFYTLYLYEKGFTDFEMGYASAMAWVLVGAISAVTGMTFFTSKYWVHYSDER